MLSSSYSLLATAWKGPASSLFFMKGCERSSPSLAAAASSWWNAQHFICSKIFITSFSSEFTVVHVIIFDSTYGNTADTKGEKVIFFLTYVPCTYPKTMYDCINLHIAVSLPAFWDDISETWCIFALLLLVNYISDDIVNLSHNVLSSKRA